MASKNIPAIRSRSTRPLADRARRRALKPKLTPALRNKLERKFANDKTTGVIRRAALGMLCRSLPDLVDMAKDKTVARDLADIQKYALDYSEGLHAIADLMAQASRDIGFALHYAQERS